MAILSQDAKEAEEAVVPIEEKDAIVK